MPATPVDLLQLSKDLHALASNEAWRRCVVSRAYYASLHAAEQTFDRTPDHLRTEGESSHAEIINRAVAYGKSIKPGRTNAALIAHSLPRLRRLRNVADYRLGETLSDKEYAEVVQRAEKVLTHCAEIIVSRERAVAAAPSTGVAARAEEARQDPKSRPALTRIK